MGTAGLVGGCGGNSGPGGASAPSSQPIGTGNGGNTSRRPNILLVLTDELRLPPKGYGPTEGEAQDIKEIFSFASSLSPNNQYARFFEGMLRLRQNAVVLRSHYIAASACTPSRTCLMTGQYYTLTGGSQTDGSFKDVTEVQFLSPDGVPTMGDWFRAAGYTSHYFGKWHVSHTEPPYSLDNYGFSDFETSGPEPHGSDPDNLGTYRDVGFADSVVQFLQQKGATRTADEQPWLAVASFVNPHDVSAYPAPWYFPTTPNNQGVLPPPGPLTVPPGIPLQGQISNPDQNGRVVDLNPDGFPQECFGVPPTIFEDLSTKPRCHLEQSYKVPLMLKSMYPFVAQIVSPYPFQMRGDQSLPWSLAYSQFYTYLHYMVDLQIRRILEALDAANLAQDTIIVFTGDHGDYGGAHAQSIQKWHSAYEEAVHVPFVISSPRINPSATVLREVSQPTSHIDLAPTLLGLAGFDASQVRGIRDRIQGQSPVPDLVGADLSPYLRGERQGTIVGPNGPRSGVLFATDDEITELPDPPVANPVKQTQYNRFLVDVEAVRAQGVAISRGSVTTPNRVRSLCTGDWKLVRYFDPTGAAADEWELYNLALDPNEAVNLVNYATLEVRTDVALPGLTTAQITQQRDQMRVDLAQQEALLLKTPS